MGYIINELLTSGLSVGVANVCTNPLDMIKVRMQLDKVNNTSIFSTATNVIKQEGVLSLWKGVGPSIARGFFFGGARLGLYTPIKTYITRTQDSNNVAMKIAAGIASGGIAAAVTSPIELLKTRLQSNKNKDSSLQIVRSIVRTDGIIGLWAGAVPGLIRASVLTASQCVSYDESKRFIRSYFRIQDGILLHLSSSMLAGLVTTTLTNPLDVIKTHMYVKGSSQGSLLSTIRTIYNTHGSKGFFIGWAASYARLGPHTIIMFVTAEQLRNKFGMKSL